MTWSDREWPRSCATCANWMPAIGQSPPPFGQCRANAPTRDARTEADGKAGWPITLQSDWCGEYESKDTPSGPGAGVASPATTPEATGKSPTH